MDVGTGDTTMHSIHKDSSPQRHTINNKANIFYVEELVHTQIGEIDEKIKDYL